MDRGAARGVRIGISCAAAAWGSVVVGAACGDENGKGEIVQIQPVEQALCHKLVECGCGESLAAFGAVLPVTCEGWTLDSLFPDDNDDGYYYGYGYEGGPEPDEQLPRSLDEACVQQIAAQIDALDCDLTFTAPDCHSWCSPVIGPRLEGQSCTQQADCGRGLRCDDDECKDPCLVTPPAAGDPCVGDDCGPTLVCVDDPDGNGGGVCTPLPSSGQPCYFGECAAGLRCDGTEDVCRPLTALGEPCMGHRECEQGYCPAGYCEPRPGMGEPCGLDGACVEGTQCVGETDAATCQPVSNACYGLFNDVIDQLIVVEYAGPYYG